MVSRGGFVSRAANPQRGEPKTLTISITQICHCQYSGGILRKWRPDASAGPTMSFEIMPTGEPIWWTLRARATGSGSEVLGAGEGMQGELWAVDLMSGEVLAAVSAVDSFELHLPGNRNMLLEIIGAKSPTMRPAAKTSPFGPNLGTALPKGLIELGQRALANCERMRETNSKILDQNHQLMADLLRKREGQKEQR